MSNTCYSNVTWCYFFFVITCYSIVTLMFFIFVFVCVITCYFNANLM
ncbi:hypothetical protein KSS87_016378, partial [Heliosperma pusillum]